MKPHRSLRRSLLAVPAAAVAAAGLAAAGPAARAQPATPIQHVVVIYLENHSFDNVLGFWCDANPGRCPDGGMPATVTLSDGTTVTPATAPDKVPQVDHNVASQQAAMHIVGHKALMDGWENIPAGTGEPACTDATIANCVSGYKPAQVPNLAALASAFAISDMTFSMADSPSWGGHDYAAMASLDGFTGNNPSVPKGMPGWGCDSDGLAQWQAPGSTTIRQVPSCIPDYSLGLPNGGAFRPTPASWQPTIFDRLDAAGLTWKIYGAAAPGVSGYSWSICPSFAECLDTGQHANLVDHLQFLSDAAAGTLPALSVITAGGSNGGGVESCHNGTSMTACDDYIGQLVQAAENGPDWPSTAVFITFDDFGGFYDQVPPGLNPDYTQRGPRVPLIIASPYARPGFTDTTATTFAGILAYTEQNFGLDPLGPNDAQAYPFTGAFDYSQAPLRPVRMVNRPWPAGAPRHLTKAEAADPS